MRFPTYWEWFKRLLSGQPHEYIGGEKRPYMKRWFLTPKFSLITVMLHKFERDDDDRALHDHPFNFISLVLKGGYLEHTKTGSAQRGFLSLAYRPAAFAHRIVLNQDRDGKRIPCWTLVIRGRKIREWFFHCEQGPVHWTKFCDPENAELPGKGCAQ